MTVNSDSATSRSAVAALTRLRGASFLVLALVACEPAFAQSALPDDPVTQGARADDDDSIVVTARRREEKLADVPVAANVVSAATLNKYNITDFTQLQTVSPGVQIARTGGGTPGATVRIRGIGVFGPDYGSDQPVSLVFDNVPVSRGHIADIGFFDQGAIQVLRGPQSLFFGKNSPAGVIATDSVNPGQTMDGYVRASYGFNQEDPQLEAAITIPLDETLSIRLAGRGQAMQGGYIRNVGRPLAANPIPDAAFATGSGALPGAGYDEYPKTKQLLGRVTVRWEPSDRFDATIKVLEGWTKYNDSYAMPVVRCGAASQSYTTGGVAYLDPNPTCRLGFITNSSRPAPAVLDRYLYAPEDGHYFRSARQGLWSFNANYHLTDNVTLTSTTGFYHLLAKQFANYDATTFAETPGAQQEKTKTFTQELRLTTDFDAPVNLTLGAFYEHENRELFQSNRIYTFGPLPAGLPDQERFAGITNSMINNDFNRGNTYSAFAQAVWKMSPTVELAGGVRYTKAEKKSQLNVLMQALDALYLSAPGGRFAASPLAPAGTRYDLEAKYDNWSPEATLSWKPAPNLLIYGAFKTGFLAGGIANPGVLSNYSDERGYSLEERTDILTFDPETTKGFEIGLKGEFFNGMLSGDLTVFDYKFKGLQIATLNPTNATFTVGNAASATNRGVEANTTLRVSDGFQLRAALAYTHLKFDTYDPAPCYPGQPRTGAPGCRPPGVPGAGTQDLSGTRFGTAPLSTNIGATFATPMTDALRLTLNGDLQSFTRSPPVNLQESTRIPGYSVANASIRVDQTDGPWALSLIGTNLFNKVYLNSVSNKPLGNSEDIIANIGPGREIRLQLEFSF